MTDPQLAGARTVVCDAGPLIHLDQLDCLDLLAGFAPVLVPEAVWKEVAHHRPDALRGSFIERTLPPVKPEPAIEALCAMLVLDQGESECLAVLAAMKEPMFFTDDAAARLAAEQLGLRIRGTIGIVTRALRSGERTATEVLEILESVPQKSTLFLRRALLDRVIAEVRSEIAKRQH